MNFSISDDDGFLLRIEIAELAPNAATGENVRAMSSGEVAIVAAMPPSKRARVVGGQFQAYDDRTLSQAKADAWARIKAERTSRLAGTFPHAGNTYDIDPINLTGASIDAREALIAGESWSQMWVLANNTTVTLTATEMIAAGRACKTVVSNLWGTSQFLRGLIEAATTTAAVDAITWP